MATKKEEKPKVAPEQVKEAQKNVAKEEAKEVPKPKAKATAAGDKKEGKKETPKQSTPKIPAYLKKGPTEFVVGTEDYAAIVAEHNKLFGTMWNTHRVRPAVFFGIYKGVEAHYKSPK